YSMHAGDAITMPLYVPPFEETNDFDAYSRGWNVLGRWTHTFTEESRLSIQSYYDHFRSDKGMAIETRDTADIQIEHRFPLTSWNDIIWGAGYRFTTDSFINTPALTFDPVSQDLNLF